jgi:phage gp29-like protein
MASYVHYYTPRILENIFRGMMAGNLVASWLAMDLMEQTWPRLSTNLNKLKDGVVGLDWNLQPFAPRGQTPSPEAERRCRILDAFIWTMKPDVKKNENNFDNTLRDVMDAVGKGISVLEINWELRTLQLDLSPKSKSGSNPKQNTATDSRTITPIQLWTPRSTRWVHPRYYGYPGYGYGATQMQQDELMLFAQEVAFSNADYSEQSGMWTEFPLNKFIISIFKQKSGHPLSGAMLRILAFYWAAQNFAWEWFINFAQIFGSPLRWATYDPARQGLLDLIDDMMRRMGSAGYGVFPDGTKINFEKGEGNARENPQKVLLDSCDEIVDIIILGQTLTTSQGQRGSQALGKIHKEGENERVQSVGQRTADVLNDQLLPACCRMNFGNDDECPIAVPSTKETKDQVAVAQKYQIVVGMGLPVPEQHLYEQLDIPVPSPGEPVFIGPAAALTPDDKPPSEPKPTVPNPESDSASGRFTSTAAAAAAMDKLTNNVMENLTGVQARWLSGVKPYFRELIAAAKNGDLSDRQFIATLERAQKHFPELFNKLDRTHLAQALEKAMGAAAINGAVGAYMRRGGAR